MPQEEIPGCGSVQRARAGGKTRGNCYLSFVVVVVVVIVQQAGTSRWQT